MNGNMGIFLLAGGLGVALLAVKGFGDKPDTKTQPTIAQADVATGPIQFAPTGPRVQSQIERWERPSENLVALGDPQVAVQARSQGKGFI